METIEFTSADDTLDLPNPVTLTELESMSMAQKKTLQLPSFAAALTLGTSRPGQGKSTPTPIVEEDGEDMMVESDTEEVLPTTTTSTNTATTNSTTAAINMTTIATNGKEGQVKIRKDYTPKAAKKGNEQTQICPRCGQAVPVSEMDEHMRIELLDPKWKQQKELVEAKTKESNILREGTDVAKNLKQLSGFRSDIFGNEEVGIGRKAGEMDRKRKEQAAWDGHESSKALATQRAVLNIDEQIQAVQRAREEQ